MNSAPTPRVPETASAFAALAAAELRQVWRTYPFWASAARNTTSVIGVLLFDWPALQLALYFVIESWLMLTLYATTDLTFNPKYGGHAPRNLREAILKPLPQFLGAAVLIGLIIGLFAMFMLVGALGADEWTTFLQDGWQQPSFLVGLAILAASCLSEAIHFARRVVRRTPVQIQADDLRIASLFYRIVLLLMASVALGWARGSWFAAPLFALAMALVLLFFETLPRSAAALLGISVPKRR